VVKNVIKKNYLLYYRCEVCELDLNVGSTGKKAILAHSQSKKHKSNSANSAHLMTPDNRRQTLLIKDHDEENLSFLNLSNSQNILRAETLLSLVQAETNSSFRSMEMRKTKYEYISVHGIGEFQKEELARNINNSVSICIVIDTATFKQKSEIQDPW